MDTTAFSPVSSDRRQRGGCVRGDGGFGGAAGCWAFGAASVVFRHSGVVLVGGEEKERGGCVGYEGRCVTLSSSSVTIRGDVRPREVAVGEDRDGGKERR
ncbi:hypothetical protein HAX54_016067 [Datura stramonium]|uniref:Uncharacterized protein n=1 Tax=Datura stramonium TaxID=4076 RepID=A0ABS8Y4S7_DATST|nr:hypothetical protein [Datura stramonium]